MKIKIKQFLNLRVYLNVWKTVRTYYYTTADSNRLITPENCFLPCLNYFFTLPLLCFHAAKLHHYER